MLKSSAISKEVAEDFSYKIGRIIVCYSMKLMFWANLFIIIKIVFTT